MEAEKQDNMQTQSFNKRGSSALEQDESTKTTLDTPEEETDTQLPKKIKTPDNQQSEAIQSLPSASVTLAAEGFNLPVPADNAQAGVETLSG